jgi:hypothetical protein
MPSIMKIDVAESWINQYQLLLNGLEFERDDKKLVSLSLLHVSLEHNSGIVTLVKAGVHGSAFALLRPQRDAFLRGIWMFRCASARQLTNFMDGKDLPGIKQQLEQVEKTDGYRHGRFSSLMAEIKDILNDHTHGGLYQSASRDKGNRISSGYQPKQLDWLIRQSMMLSFLACLEVCHIFNEARLSQELTQEFDKIIRQTG